MPELLWTLLFELLNTKKFCSNRKLANNWSRSTRTPMETWILIKHRRIDCPLGNQCTSSNGFQFHKWLSQEEWYYEGFTQTIHVHVDCLAAMVINWISSCSLHRERCVFTWSSASSWARKNCVCGEFNYWHRHNAWFDLRFTKQRPGEKRGIQFARTICVLACDQKPVLRYPREWHQFHNDDDQV